MSIAVITHVDEPSIDVLRSRVRTIGQEILLYRSHRGELPAIGDHDAWVVLGGPQSVYDDRVAFRPEVDRLARAVELEVPVLAICLGAQLMAEATGGRALPGAHGLECGVIEVRAVTSDQQWSGRHFSFHSDSMEPPPGADVLAVSDRYLQAWRFGSALAVQFHPELDARGFDALLALEEQKLAHYGIDVAALRAELAEPQRLPPPSERLLDTWLAGITAASRTAANVSHSPPSTTSRSASCP